MTSFVENVLSVAKTSQAKIVLLAVATIVGYTFTFRKASSKVSESLRTPEVISDIQLIEYTWSRELEMFTRSLYPIIASILGVGDERGGRDYERIRERERDRVDS